MRIIAGSFRGRRLRAPAGRAVRPTGDRMKESMFSALGDVCRGAAVLDLFAGSGALGLEALSRGAREVTFVERARESLAALARNIEELQAGERCRVVREDGLRFFERERAISWDLVFADPPFPADLGRRVLDWWLDTAGPGRVLVLEFPEDKPPLRPGDKFAPLRTRSFGASCYGIYQWPLELEEA